MILKPSRYRFILLAAVIVLPFSAAAQQAGSETQQLSAKITEHLALEYQLGEAPEDIRIQFEQNPLQLPSDVNERMLSHFDDAYEEEMLLDDFTAALSENLEDTYQSEIANWLEEESIQSITNTRQEFYTLEGKRKRVITMYEMDQDPPAAERVALVESLTDATSVAESSVESSIVILRSILKALSSLSTQQTFSDPQIDGIANNFRAQIADQVKNEYNSRMLVLFYDVESPALESYKSFWETEAGQSLDNSISQSFEAAYQSAGERFLQSVNNDQ